MIYRVKFKCYYYNTGNADNHTYYNHEDFDKLKKAKIFQNKIIEQYRMTKKYQDSDITLEEYDSWLESFDFYDVDNGYICNDNPIIVKYYPSKEIPI